VAGCWVNSWRIVEGSNIFVKNYNCTTNNLICWATGIFGLCFNRPEKILRTDLSVALTDKTFATTEFIRLRQQIFRSSQQINDTDNGTQTKFSVSTTNLIFGASKKARKFRNKHPRVPKLSAKKLFQLSFWEGKPQFLCSPDAKTECGAQLFDFFVVFDVCPSKKARNIRKN
jgi:hypothetical protein